jgi:hypothetical protein
VAQLLECEDDALLLVGIDLGEQTALRRDAPERVVAQGDPCPVTSRMSSIPIVSAGARRSGCPS